MPAGLEPDITVADPVAYTKAIRNILEDFAEERERYRSTQRAILNVLEDSSGEKALLEDTQKAVLNILGDLTGEKERLGAVQKAILNILEDFGGEKSRLEATQRAVLNILEDFDVEKKKVQQANDELKRENTDRLHAEQALTRSNAELEQFAYVASHDLQEPLRMVSAYVQLLEKRYKEHLDAQADKYINYAVDGAKRMEALIGALLQYSRAGRQDVELEVVDANAALDAALANLKAAIEESGAVVTRDPLPAVRGHRVQLSQVLQNLLGNALKFRKPDTVPRVHVSAAREGALYTFSVRDNGIGIDKAYSDRLFVIFQRLHTRAEFPGTGIGLAICRKVVERLGGRIWFESEPGEGATFFFTVPGAG